MSTNQNENGDLLTDQEHLILTTFQRCGAAISLLASLSIAYSVLSNPYYKRRIFHRIMLACSLNTIILNINMSIGPAAVPVGTDGFYDRAKGTTQTCSAQGFFYMWGYIVPSYYASLSLLSYKAVRNKFNINKYAWVEPYVHVVVYIYPLVIGCYLLSVQGFNPALADCYFASIPRECGDWSPPDAYVECERGPENYGSLARWVIGFPLGVILAFPTAVMGLLWCQVRCSKSSLELKSLSERQIQLLQQRHQMYIRKLANSVCIQSLIYLLAIYWTYIPRFIFMLLEVKLDKYIFGWHVFANLIESMQGIWIAMSYYYFRSDPLGSSSAMTSSTKFILSLKVKKNNKNNSANKGKPTRTFTGKDDDDDDDKSIIRDNNNDNDDGKEDDQRLQPRELRTSRRGEESGAVTSLSPPIRMNLSERDSDQNNDNGRNSENKNKNNNNNNSYEEPNLSIPSPTPSGILGVHPFPSIIPPVVAKKVRKPSFSIFDGFGTTPDPDSPWAEYLQDSGEDDSYQEENNGEYEDTAFLNL